jgi:hypothetical protein
MFDRPAIEVLFVEAQTGRRLLGSKVASATWIRIGKVRIAIWRRYILDMAYLRRFSCPRPVSGREGFQARA